MNTTTAECAGAQPVPDFETLYTNAAADLRRVLMLADIAAAAGNHRRAAQHLLGALEDFAPELAQARLLLPRP